MTKIQMQRVLHLREGSGSNEEDCQGKVEIYKTTDNKASESSKDAVARY